MNAFGSICTSVGSSGHRSINIWDFDQSDHPTPPRNALGFIRNVHDPTDDRALVVPRQRATYSTIFNLNKKLKVSTKPNT